MENLRIGDEVKYATSDARFVITHINADGTICGISANGMAFVDKNPKQWIRTGKHYPEAKTLMQALNRKTPEYPCINCCSPSERAFCCGCEKEKQWRKKYGTDEPPFYS